MIKASVMTYPHQTAFSTWVDSPQTVHDESRLAFMPIRRGMYYAQSSVPRQPIQQRQDPRPWQPSFHSSPYIGPVQGSQATVARIPPGPAPNLPSSVLRRSLFDDPAFSVDPSSNPNHWQRLPPPPLPPNKPSFVPVAEDSPRDSTFHKRASSEGALARNLGDHRRQTQTAPDRQLKALSATNPDPDSDPQDSGSMTPQSATPFTSPLAAEFATVYISPSSGSSSQSSSDLSEASGPSAKEAAARSQRSIRRKSSHRKPPPSYDESVDAHAESSEVHAQPSAVDQKPPLVVLSYDPQENQEQLTLRPKRASDTALPADLDRIDELDETDPMGLGFHHKGPYDLIAATVGQHAPASGPQQTNDTRDLRHPIGGHNAKAETPRKSSKRRKDVPPPERIANPLALNLKPGQILPPTIFNPSPTSPTFPLTRAPATYPPDHYLQIVNVDTNAQPTNEYGTSAPPPSPLRRNYTLPASVPRVPPEQSSPDPYVPEVPPSSFRSSPSRVPPRSGQPPAASYSGRQIPVENMHTLPTPSPSPRPRAAPVYHPGPAEQALGNYSHYFVAPSPPMPPRPLRSNTTPEPRRPYPENGYRGNALEGINQDGSSRTARRQAVMYGGPPSLHASPPRQFVQSPRPAQVHENILPGRHATPSPAPIEPEHSSREARRHASLYVSRNPRPEPAPSLPTYENGATLPYMPPTEMIAALKQADLPLPGGPPPEINLPPPSIASSSSSQQHSAPRHVPKRLVMPAPLAPQPTNVNRDAPFDPYAVADKPKSTPRRTKFRGKLEVRFESPPPMTAQTVPMTPGGKNLLRKKSAPVMPPPPHHQPQASESPPPLPPPPPPPPPLEPQKVQHTGVLSLFGFGKGVKRTEIREVKDIREVRDVRDDKQRAQRKLSRKR